LTPVVPDCQELVQPLVQTLMRWIPVSRSSVGGAYPSMVEWPDYLVYCVYCEEGKGSSIRGVRLRVDKKGVKVVGK
jgi:hypothetical protein